MQGHSATRLSVNARIRYLYHIGSDLYHINIYNFYTLILSPPLNQPRDTETFVSAWPAPHYPPQARRKIPVRQPRRDTPTDPQKQEASDL